MDVLFVFVRSINHVFIDVEHSAAIDEKSVEPKVKGRLVVVVKLNADVIVHKQVLVASDVEIDVADISDMLGASLRLLLVVYLPLVENVALADHLEVRDHPPSLQVGHRDHPYLVKLLDHCFVIQVLVCLHKL